MFTLRSCNLHLRSCSLLLRLREERLDSSVLAKSACLEGAGGMALGLYALAVGNAGLGRLHRGSAGLGDGGMLSRPPQPGRRAQGPMRAVNLGLMSHGRA